ncbi:MAG: TerC family protein [Hyphomicrobiaceae bacterium]
MGDLASLSDQGLQWINAVFGDNAGTALAILRIIGINIVLSGDNAVVIALACRALPARQRMMGIILGAGAAVLLRVIFTVVIQYLLDVPWLQLIGGILLFWIAIKLLIAEEASEDSVAAGGSLFEAVKIVAIADIVMSLDNVLAIAGAAKSAPPELQIWLIVIGLLISIPLVVFGATLIVTLLTRYPVLVWVGAALLGWIAGELMVSDRIALLQMQAWNPALVAPAPDTSLGIKATSVVLYSAATIGVIIVMLSGWLLQKPRHHQGSHGAAE